MYSIATKGDTLWEGVLNAIVKIFYKTIKFFIYHQGTTKLNIKRMMSYSFKRVHS